MLRSVSNHLEPAHGAFTRSRALDEQVVLTVTRHALLDQEMANAGNEPCMGTFLYCKQEHFVANNKNPNQKQPGEKEPGTFHYNPGNMSGKIIGTSKDKSEQKSDADRPHSSSEQPDKKAVDN
jgi:hypothetical protein